MASDDRDYIYNPDIQVETSTPRSDGQETTYVSLSHTPGVCPRPSMTPQNNYKDIDHKATQVSSAHVDVI